MGTFLARYFDMPRFGSHIETWIGIAFTAILLCSCLSSGSGGSSAFPWPTADRCIAKVSNALSLLPAMNAPVCTDALSYQYDVSRFDPDIDESLEPERTNLVHPIETRDSVVSVELDEILFSTRVAAESDPKGLEEFPETYRYSEYRVSLRPEYGVKAIGVSSQSVEAAFSKAVALCEKRIQK